MFLKSYNKSFKEICSFFLKNIFVVIIALLVATKVIYFNKAFGLLKPENAPIVVPVIVTLVLTALFFLPFVFKDKDNFKRALILDLVITTIIYGDTVYMRYYNSLPSVQSIFYADSVFGVMSSVVSLLKVKDVIFFLDIPILIYANRIFKDKIASVKQKNYREISYVVSFLVISCFLFIFTYDFKNVKLLTTRVYDNKVTAGRYGAEAYHLIDLYNFASYHLQFLSSSKKEEIINEAKKYITNEESNSKTGVAKNKNIILLQVESLQNSVINQKVEGQEITPNINQLVKSSDYFNNHYYQLGFGGTADTDFTVNTSVYPMKNAAGFVQYGKDKYNGLAEILRQEGYSTNAYHAFNRSFWNRNVAFKSLGYQRFLGAESYQGGKYIQMGTGDYEFLAKTVQDVKQEKFPSLSYVITLTSHHPFELPAEEKTLILKGNYPENIANYYQAIHYTDKAIGNFIDQLKKNDLFDESLIVLYGDHSPSLGDLSSDQAIKALGESGNINDIKERTELKKVPLVIHFPGQKGEMIHSNVSSHIDIMPTILNMVGLKPKIPMFGQDLYGQQKPYFASVLYFDSGIIISDDKVYADGPIAGLENGKCYLVGGNQWLQVNTKACADLVAKRDKEQEISKDLTRYNLFDKVK
jgi:phosphoglycerol transferase MdoB-like AlkP superfamily enzyme